MSSTLHQPHDKFFKLSMGEPQVAHDFLQAYLPPALLQTIDLSTLKLEKNSFIDEAYKTHEADIIYQIQLAGHPAYIYTLCEHQTEVDRHMAFRLLTYTVRLIEAHRVQHPDDFLPLVYPMVIYSGEKAWDAPLAIFPLFGEQAALAREWLTTYQLLDLQRISDEDLQKPDLSSIMTFALKYRQVRDFAVFLKKFLPKIYRLEEYAQGPYLARIVLQYIVDGMPSDDVAVFKEQIQQLPTQLKGEAMTIAQSLEQRGFEKGIQQGMQQGMQQGVEQGVQQGEAAIILLQIQKRFGKISPDYTQMIYQADTQTLLTWGARLLDAKTLEEIFH